MGMGWRDCPRLGPSTCAHPQKPYAAQCLAFGRDASEILCSARMGLRLSIKEMECKDLDGFCDRLVCFVCWP